MIGPQVFLYPEAGIFHQCNKHLSIIEQVKCKIIWSKRTGGIKGKSIMPILMPLRLSSKHGREFGGVLPARTNNNNKINILETTVQNIATVSFHFRHSHNVNRALQKCGTAFQSRMEFEFLLLCQLLSIWGFHFY